MVNSGSEGGQSYAIALAGYAAPGFSYLDTGSCSCRDWLSQRFIRGIWKCAGIRTLMLISTHSGTRSAPTFPLRAAHRSWTRSTWAADEDVGRGKDS